MFLWSESSLAADLTLRLHGNITRHYEKTYLDYGLGPQETIPLKGEINKYILLTIKIKDEGYSDIEALAGFFVNQMIPYANWGAFFDIDYHTRLGSDTGFDVNEWGAYGSEGDAVQRNLVLSSYDDTRLNVSLSFSLNLESGEGSFRIADPSGIDDRSFVDPPFWYLGYEANIFAYEVPELGIVVGNPRAIDEGGVTIVMLGLSLVIMAAKTSARNRLFS